ncbi:7367_t:CDS:1, partial [Paraglomus occultum]
CWERADILPDELEAINYEPPDNNSEIEDKIVQSLIDRIVDDIDSVIRIILKLMIL